MINYDIFISGKKIDNVVLGFTTNDKLDSSFSEARFTIFKTEKKERYLPFEKCTISINGENKYYYIASDEVTQISTKTKLYRHIINLVEPTKRLELVACDTLTFVQPNGNEKVSRTAYTMLDVVNRIRFVCPLEIQDKVDKTRIFDIDPTLATYLQSIRAPEFYLTRLTLYEALKQVFQFINALPVIKSADYRTLTADFFNEVGESVKLENLTKYIDSQGLDTYASKGISHIDNMTSENEEQAAFVYPSKNGWAIMKPVDGEAIYDVKKIGMTVPKPIQQILKVEMRMLIKFANDKQGNTENIVENWIDASVSSYTVSKPIWETLPFFDGPNYAIYPLEMYDGIIVEGGRQNVLFGKNTTFYFTEGDTTIYQGNTDSSTEDVLTQRKPTQSLFYAGLQVAFRNNGKIFSKTGIISPQIPTITDTETILYRITYVPKYDAVVSLERSNLNETLINAETYINQATNLVNANAYGLYLNGIVNRMGNSEIIAEKQVKNYEDCFKINQKTTDNYIVANVENSYFNDYITSTAILSKDFNRISEFIGVNGEIRQYSIPAAGQTVIRHTRYTEFIELSNKFNNYNESFFTIDGINSFMKVFVLNNVTFKSVGGCLFNSYNNYLLYIECNTVSCGNSLVFTFGFEDNISAGTSIIKKDKISSIRDIPYVKTSNLSSGGNINGELNRFDFKLIDSAIPTINDNIGEVAKRLPEVYASDYLARGNVLIQTPAFTILKDPAEILKMSYSLEVVNAVGFEDTYVTGRCLFDRNPLINISYTKYTLYIYESDTPYNKFENLYAKGEINNFASYEVSIMEEDNENKKYSYDETYIRFSGLTPGKNIAIGDAKKNLYLAINHKEGQSNEYVYFNFCNKRSRQNKN